MKYDSEQMTFVGAAATAEESAALRLHYEIMAAAQAAAKGGVTDGHPAFDHRQRCSGRAAGHRLYRRGSRWESCRACG